MDMLKLHKLLAETRAVTAMEYALLGSLIAIAIIGVVATMGTDIGSVFNSIANNL